MSFSAPNSEVDICNLALSYLKQRRIVQLSPATSPEEELCASHYHQVRRSTLRGHMWNFAGARAVLAANSTPPAFEFSQAFDFPSDFIRYAGRYTDLGERIPDKPGQFAVEGNQLLLNVSASTAVNVKYICDKTEVVAFDPLFIKVFSLSLAIEIGPQFAGSPRILDRLEAKLEKALLLARSIDGQEQPPERVTTSRFVQARRGSRYRSNNKYVSFE